MTAQSGSTLEPFVDLDPERGRKRVVTASAREARWGLVFVAPFIIGFLLFYALPMVASLVLSFTNFDPRNADETQFIGLANYVRMFDDPALAKSALVTLRFAVLVVPLTMAFSLGVALLVNHTFLRGRNVFRTLFYMPIQIPIVASTIVWIGVLNTNTGWLNEALRAAGLGGPDWFNSTFWVHPALAIMGLWGIGNMMLIFLAGLQSVPSELYDAAKVDGAGPWATFRKITLPMISPVIFYNLIIVLIATFQYFTQAYVITNGRGDPNGETLFYNLNLYREAFQFFNMGYASALAWALFVVVLGLTVVLFRTAGSWVYEGGSR
jgi:multiple sugar transport system permease protein